MGKVHCIYGQSGTGKTSMLEEILLWYRTKHKNAKARLVTAEDCSTIQGSIDEGLIEAWHIDERDWPFETSDRAVLGHWPEDVDDPDSELVKPTLELFEEYPIYFIEGLSTIAYYMLGGWAVGGLAEQTGRGIRVMPGGRPGDDAAAFKDGSKSNFPVGGNSMSHFGLVQRQMHSRVVKSRRLPALVFWTAHEVKSKKDEYGASAPVFGPEVCGTAATPQVPRWFGHLLHMSVVPKEAKAKDPWDCPLEWRVFLKEHYDPNHKGYPFKAQARLPKGSNIKLPLYIPAERKEIRELLDTLFPSV